jgi:heptosyltransferase-2
MPRILIVAPAWIGDMVTAQSLVAELKRRQPEAVIDLLAPPWTAPLGERMPGVARTILIDTEHGRFDLPMRFRFGRSLRREAYDRAIVLPSSLKSTFIPFFAGIPRRTGYVGEWRYGLLNDARPLDKEKLKRTVDRIVALAGKPDEALPEISPPVIATNAGGARALAERLGLPLDRPVVALCPGAEYGPAKQWPAPHFAALADILARQGVQSWIFGSLKDVALGETIRSLAVARNGRSAPVNLAGRTTLLDAVDLMSLAAGVATNDSGLMHVAAAIGRPIVALYGSTTPELTPPLGPVVSIVERTLPCRPCSKRVCPLGHLNCLNLIAAADVAALVLDQVERTA